MAQLHPPGCGGRRVRGQVGVAGLGGMAGSCTLRQGWREPACGQRSWGWLWVTSRVPTALSPVISLTCEAPPRDPNQCELVDRPRYRKGPHICFDYNATVCGVQGALWGEEPHLGGPQGRDWGNGCGGVGGKQNVGCPQGSRSMGCPLGGNWDSGFPLRGAVEPWGDTPVEGADPWGDPRESSAVRDPPMGVQSCGRTWGVRSLGVPPGEIRAMGDP